MSEKVRIELEHDEALVLFEYLARCQVDDDYVPAASEKIALANLECLLEKQVVELFSPKYQQELEAARSRLREQYGDR